jgi:hypothetical protein
LGLVLAQRHEKDAALGELDDQRPPRTSQTLAGRRSRTLFRRAVRVLYTYHSTNPGTRPFGNILPDNTSFSTFGIITATSSRSCLRARCWWVLVISFHLAFQEPPARCTISGKCVGPRNAD